MKYILPYHLYLNDKRVTTVDLYSIVKETEYKLKEYEVIPHQFDKDYILVEVKSKLDDNLYEEKNTASLVLISLDSKLIETFEWSSNTKIRRTTTNQILTYEIGEDYIMLYEVSDDKVNKAMYTIKNGQLEKEITREYIIDKDVILNGK